MGASRLVLSPARAGSARRRWPRPPRRTPPLRGQDARRCRPTPRTRSRTRSAHPARARRRSRSSAGLFAQQVDARARASARGGRCSEYLVAAWPARRRPGGRRGADRAAGRRGGARAARGARPGRAGSLGPRRPRLRADRRDAAAAGAARGRWPVRATGCCRWSGGIARVAGARRATGDGRRARCPPTVVRRRRAAGRRARRGPRGARRRRRRPCGW